MKAYRDWAPTGMDPRGLWTPDTEERMDWLVVGVMQTRDSGPLDQSNFEAAWKEISQHDTYGDDFTEHQDCVQLRFGHWGPGWFEIVLVRPGSKCAEVAAGIEEKMDGYPVLDEEDFSRREMELAEETWTNMSVRERVELLQEYDLCIFAARRSEYPHDIDHNGRLYDNLRTV